MVYQNGDIDWDTGLPISPDLVGMSKALKRVLQECGLWREGLRKQCNAGKKKKDDKIVESAEDFELRKVDQCEKGPDCCAI